MPKSKYNPSTTYRIGREPGTMKPHNASTWRKIVSVLENDGVAIGSKLEKVCKGHVSGSRGAPHDYQFVRYCVNSEWLVPETQQFADSVLPEADESRFPEGAARYRLHRRFERDTALVRRVKQKQLTTTGCLACDICGFDFAARYGERGLGFIEAHHVIPVSELNGTMRTREADLVLVCSNCHRMLHRGPALLSPEELKVTMVKASQI